VVDTAGHARLRAEVDVACVDFASYLDPIPQVYEPATPQVRKLAIRPSYDAAAAERYARRSRRREPNIGKLRNTDIVLREQNRRDYGHPLRRFQRDRILGQSLPSRAERLRCPILRGAAKCQRRPWTIAQPKRQLTRSIFPSLSRTPTRPCIFTDPTATVKSAEAFPPRAVAIRRRDRVQPRGEDFDPSAGVAHDRKRQRRIGSVCRARCGD